MRKQAQNHFDVLIAGGGIAGLTLALLLAQKDMRVALIDPQAPAPLSQVKASGRTVALLERSVDLLKDAGIWDDLENHSNPLSIMRIVDNSFGNGRNIQIDFDAREIGMERYGYNIPNAIVRAALFEKAKQQKNIMLYVPGALYDFQNIESHVLARLEDGTELTAPLIIGCDGRSSAVREIAQIKHSKKHYDQSALTFLIAHEKHHQNTATEFHKAGGPLAIVPLPGQQSSVVWVEDKSRAEALLHLKKNEFINHFQTLTGKLMGDIDLKGGVESWPFCTIKAQTLTAPRVALAAEAAHVMSPITAQGLNLSLRDVGVLRDVIVEAALLGLDYGGTSILSRYEKARIMDINSRVYGVDGMNRIVAQNSAVIKKLRRRGLKTLSHFSPLKEFIMTQGLAPNY